MVVKQIQHQLKTGFQTSWFLPAPSKGCQLNPKGWTTEGYGELGVAKGSPSWNSIAAQGV